MVDAGQVGGRHDPQPGCADARRPAGTGIRVTSSSATPRRSRRASSGGTQVGAARQPDLRVLADRGLGVLVVPLGGPVALVDQVGLPGDEELVDPPVVGVAPPGPQPGLLAEQGADVTEPVRVGQLQRAVGLDEAGPAVVVRGPHLVEQPGGADVALRGRQRAQRDGRRDQHQCAERDHAPAPETGHLDDGTSAAQPVEPSTGEGSLRNALRRRTSTRRPAAPATQRARCPEGLVAEGVAVGPAGLLAGRG